MIEISPKDREYMAQKQALLELFAELQVPDSLRVKWIEKLDSSDIRSKSDAKILAYFSIGREIRKAKQADYGLTWREYGLDGVFFNIATKFGRLKSLLWRRNETQVKTESIWDTLIDLINYTFYAIFLLEEGNLRGQDDA